MSALLDHPGLDTWLARALLEAERLPLEQLQAELAEARTRRSEGVTLARSLVERGLVASEELLDFLEPLVQEAITVGGPPEAESPPTGWRVGAKIGRLVLRRKLGAGGMGVVWLAEDPQSGAHYAVKTLIADADPDLCLRFLREGEAQARVDRHPNVVRVHSMARAHGRLYIVLDYVDGGDLDERLRSGPLEIEDAVRLVRDLARGMEHVHELGVLHRDLKPANVLFDEAGQPKLVDFGLAQLTAGAEALTRTGDLLGTPAFMAPEQALGLREGIGPATDVYGLGAILYQCLTGRPPFEGPSTLAVLAAVAGEDPPTLPSRLRAEIPNELEQILLEALHKDPAQRPQTARALASRLDGFLRGENSPPSASRFPLAGAAALTIALGAAALLLAPTPEPGPLGAALPLPGTVPEASDRPQTSRPATAKTRRDPARNIEDRELREALEAALREDPNAAERLLSRLRNDISRAELEKIPVAADVVRCLEAMAEAPLRLHTLRERPKRLWALRELTRIPGEGSLAWKRAFASTVLNLGVTGRDRRDSFYLVGFALALAQDREALDWLELGAQAGDQRCLVVLGNLYRGGFWISQDLPRAASYYERVRAESLVYPDACWFLATLLLDQGEAGERKRALELLEDLATGDSSSQRKSQAVQRLWLELQHEAPQRILRWLKPAVEEGHVTDPDARWRLGCALRLGKHIEQDLPAAAHWLRLAAESGEHTWAGLDYGFLFEKGEGVEANGQTARQWYERSLPRNRFANTRLGGLYERGAPGLPADLARARTFYAKAAAAGEPWARTFHARLLAEGRGGPKDEAEAARQLRLATQGREPLINALTALAELLRKRPDLANAPDELRRCEERIAAEKGR